MTLGPHQWSWQYKALYERSVGVHACASQIFPASSQREGTLTHTQARMPKSKGSRNRKNQSNDAKDKARFACICVRLCLCERNEKHWFRFPVVNTISRKYYLYRFDVPPKLFFLFSASLYSFLSLSFLFSCFPLFYLAFLHRFAPLHLGIVITFVDFIFSLCRLRH